jgi:hypothetical protein
MMPHIRESRQKRATIIFSKRLASAATVLRRPMQRRWGLDDDTYLLFDNLSVGILIDIRPSILDPSSLRSQDKVFFSLQQISL